MIHIYWGDGKGKTTAAMGLALRMAGRGQSVAIAQFMKGQDSGERAALALLPNVTLLDIPKEVKFSFALTQEEFQAEADRSLRLLEEAAALARQPGWGLLVLDEVCTAVEAGLLPLQAVLDCLDVPAEVVLTGHQPHQALLDRANYITRMEKLRHPYDRGISARRGVEF